MLVALIKVLKTTPIFILLIPLIQDISMSQPVSKVVLQEVTNFLSNSYIFKNLLIQMFRFPQN